MIDVVTIPCRQKRKDGEPCATKFAGANDRVREMFRDNHERVVHGWTADEDPYVPPPTGYKETSREAYQEALPKLNETEQRILGLYGSHGALTDETLFELYTTLYGAAYRNTVLPARNSLYKQGLVIDTGTRASVKSGRTAIVWAKR